MKVPFLDLKSQYDSIRERINSAVSDVMECCAFAGGPFVEKFEENFADFCRCREAIGVGNGTEALWLSLLALGIGPGDEVITVPNTFIATAEAISFCGAIPVFVDIDDSTYTMDPGLLEEAITPRTKAIIPVHMYGQMANMDPIMTIAEKHGLYVVEDACQAHGAQYKGRPAGSIGDAGCFSFYPGKNLGAFGEAGAIVTNNSILAQKIRNMRDHGQSRKYYHSIVGWNARMDGIQAAILNVKLEYLPEWNELRRKHARMYTEILSGNSLVIPPVEAENRRHIYHLYAIRYPHRDGLIEALKDKDIHCAIHYPLPIHMQEAYRDLGLERGNYPVSENVASELVSLPMFPELTPFMIETVCREIKEWSANGNAYAM